jgi:hypothetical protein
MIGNASTNQLVNRICLSPSLPPLAHTASFVKSVMSASNIKGISGTLQYINTAMCLCVSIDGVELVIRFIGLLKHTTHDCTLQITYHTD